MMTVELTAVLAAIPQNTEDNPLYVCERNGVLSYRSKHNRVPSGTDVNTLTASGTYLLEGSCTNIPPGMSSVGCVVKIDKWDSNRIYQELTGLLGKYYRYKSFDTWYPWNKVTASAVGGEWGGVKRLLSTLCTLRQKGGRLDGDNRTHQFARQKRCNGCDDVQRYILQHRRVYDTWCILRRRNPEHGDLSGQLGILEVRKPGGIGIPVSTESATADLGDRAMRHSLSDVRQDLDCLEDTDFLGYGKEVAA